MKRFSKVSLDNIKTIQVDSGVLLKEFDVENPVFLSENVICATSGGINPVCAPEYYDFGEDVDNAKTAKETKRIRGWNVSISFTTFTTSLDLIRLALGAADISGKVLSIRQKLQYAKDFKDIWWVGERADGIIVAIKLIRSLSDSGFSLQTNKRGKGQISVTLKGHSSFAEKDKIPMESYVLAESDIPIIPDPPETPTASLYLYGTPSETGNIGLRVGESVTMYDGAVLPKLSMDLPYMVLYTQSIFGVKYYVLRAFSEYDTMGEKLAYGDGVWGDRLVVTDNPHEWRKTGTHEAGNVALNAILWANFDVLNSDGSVNLQGTDPVPVSGLVGYKYGSAVLPDIKTVYTDELKAEYPFATLEKGIFGYGDFYTIRAFSENAYYFEGAGGTYFGGDSDTTHVPAVTFKINIGDTAWGEPQYHENNNASVNSVIWCNFDLLNTDGTVRREATEPIPVYE